ncbi:MAG TPA: alanine--tRNA ligase [Bacteroidales bacterium]|nr:alanine--tRNA ligase [Bacteroidales bacterium]
MTSNEVRKSFLQFFKRKNHEIVPSAPMVIKDDPSLMFTNAGMNQFKDIFLGNKNSVANRVADAQKCLRVSGKHNDLEQVGHDTYHHTMFEMLGNWSFGDYFKEEAIAWAWEYLTDVLKINPEKLYVTVFEGSEDDGTNSDAEAFSCWEKHIAKDRILYGSKKDNFWQMGDTGPCGPCSEIHIDLRSDEERETTPGKELINKDHPLVIEIWNLVFIQFNRKASGKLEELPHKHVDTGMGFERLCMAIQEKKSNYDTDIFQPLIREISKFSGIAYGADNQSDIAMRVVSDHLRAVAFSISDGQLPSNNKAGYVIRRILRRAVRYGYTFLNQTEPFICNMANVLVEQMGEAYPELKSQQQLIESVIREEENAFLKTLDTGIRMLEDLTEKAKAENSRSISGKDAFVLYDTYGFPLDLTELILKEKNFTVNKEEFEKEMQQQKARSRNSASLDTEDWVKINDLEEEGFVGYDQLQADVKILRYRKIKTKKKELYQIVFNVTPFYAESGGQVGDSGYIESADGERIRIIDTKKEHNLPIHLADKLPANPSDTFKAVVNDGLRIKTACNHTATHLLHQALREVLGTHVEQKGSLVHPDYLRFDFSHFQKVTKDEINEVEKLVNQRIRRNISLKEKRSVPMEEAVQEGAMALFGEKYGDKVRVVRFDDSVELCGGTHVKATGQLGYFIVVSEGSVAAGVRRIEAITGEMAQKYITEHLEMLEQVGELLQHPKDPVKSLQNVLTENDLMQKQIDQMAREKVKGLKDSLLKSVIQVNGMNLIAEEVVLDSPDHMKDLAFQLKGQVENLFLILGARINGKASLAIMVSENLVAAKQLHAGNMIREIAREIDGGGGGQPFFATAGGKNPDGIPTAIAKAKEYVSKL